MHGPTQVRRGEAGIQGRVVPRSQRRLWRLVLSFAGSCGHVAPFGRIATAIHILCTPAVARPRRGYGAL